MEQCQYCLSNGDNATQRETNNTGQGQTTPTSAVRAPCKFGFSVEPPFWGDRAGGRRVVECVCGGGGGGGDASGRLLLVKS